MDVANTDRQGFELDREAFGVLVRPYRADCAPVGIVALQVNMPGQIAGCPMLLILLCHEKSPFIWLACLTPFQRVGAKENRCQIHYGPHGTFGWSGQDIER